MFTRTRTVSLVLLIILLLAIAAPSAYASIIIPSNTTTAFIQTTGPNAALGIGDFRTNAAGDNLPHEIVVNVACTLGQTYVFQVFDPAIDVAGDPPGVGADGVTTRVTDEVRGGIDTTNFVLLSPAGAALANVTYNTGTADADWTTLATVATTGTAGVDCGDYTVRVSTADDDDNAWRFRLVGGPALPPAETFDPAIGPDGVANTGDESSVGILAVSYQHVVGGCQDFFWFVQDGTPSIFMLAFDMDGAGSITYQTPSGANITGTVSGATVWNDTAPQQAARPALADMDTFDVAGGDLIGDATLNPEVGLWRATICIPTANNQYSFEVSGAPPVFLAPPELPDVVIVKDDSVVPVTSPGTTTYTLTITNNGPGAAMPIAGPEVVDTLPAGMTFVSCTVNAPLTGTCAETAPGSGIINVNLTAQAGPPAFLAYLPGPAAAPRDTGTISVTANINAGLAGGTSLTNVAQVDWTDSLGNDYPPTSDDDVDTVAGAGASADLALSKDDGSSTYTAGGTTTYTITVRNNGPDNVTGATVVDNLPAAITSATWTCVATGVAACTAGPVVGNINDTVDLNAGAGNFLTYTVVATIDPAATGNLTNTATVSTPAGTTDPTPGNNSASDTDTPPGGGGGPTATTAPGGGGGGGGGGSPTATPGPILVDPVITKEASVDVARIGDAVTFTLTVTNPNTMPVTNVTVSDPLPAQLDFISVATTFGSCAYDAGAHTVNCNLGMLAAQQVVTITIQTRVNDKARPPETLRNAALIVGDRPDRRSSGQAEDSVIVIPDEIPVTGKGPGLRELLVIAALAMLAASLPLAGWFLWRRRNA